MAIYTYCVKLCKLEMTYVSLVRSHALKIATKLIQRHHYKPSKDLQISILLLVVDCFPKMQYFRLWEL